MAKLQMSVMKLQMLVKLQKDRSTSGTNGAHSPRPPHAHSANPTVSCTSSLEETSLGMCGCGTSCCMGCRVT